MFTRDLISQEHLLLGHAGSMWDNVTEVIPQVLIPNRKPPPWTPSSAEL